MYRWWWEQSGIDLEGAKIKAAEAATDLKSDSDSGGEESSGASGASGVERKIECPYNDDGPELSKGKQSSKLT